MKIIISRRAAIASMLFLLSPMSACCAGENDADILVLMGEQIDANGNPMPGLAINTALVKLLAAESGLKLVVRAYPWRRAQMLAQQGEGLLYGAASTAERAKVFNFTQPLYVSRQWLVTPAQRPINFKDWDDLRGKVISIPSGGRYDTAFEQHRDKTFKVEDNATTITARLKMVGSGRADALMIDSYRNAPQLESRLNCMFAESGVWRVTPNPIGLEPLLIAVPKASPLNTLLPALNDAIDRLVKSNAIQKFLEQRATNDNC